MGTFHPVHQRQLLSPSLTRISTNHEFVSRHHNAVTAERVQTWTERRIPANPGNCPQPPEPTRAPRRAATHPDARAAVLCCARARSGWRTTQRRCASVWLPLRAIPLRSSPRQTRVSFPALHSRAPRARPKRKAKVVHEEGNSYFQTREMKRHEPISGGFATANTPNSRLRESPLPLYRSAALVKVLLERLRRAHRALRVLRSTWTMLATQGSGS